MNNDDRKIQDLKEKIYEFVYSSLVNAAASGKIEHLHLEIDNHKGNLQMNCTIKERIKAY